MYYSTCNNAEVLDLKVGDRLTTPTNTWSTVKGKNPATGKWEELKPGTEFTVVAIRDSRLNRYQIGSAQEGGTGAIYAEQGDLYIDGMTDDGFRIGNVLAIGFFQ